MIPSEDGREAIRRANQRRGVACRRCGSESLRPPVDGSRCGGMPGISYVECGACGDARPVKARARAARPRGGKS